ncbi:helix-turn-helix domain-containing protein [Bradyrhizobium sp. AZCC 1708]|uniref:helix-turn-helix domain-containing protein n=1 Tax=Bradyrhizobium sp. AZCC 1708 TaxID=3117015 RepID=UPI003FA5E7AC
MRKGGSLQLRHLRYFVKIVEAGSFSRAAATIHVAQPALSQQIAELEEELGVPGVAAPCAGHKPYARWRGALPRSSGHIAADRAIAGNCAFDRRRA